MSILSFPERGQGGDARYRGNCSPKVYEWLLRESGATSLLDPCLGGGTSLDVALRLGLCAAGADLSTSAYHQRLAERLRAQGADVQLGFNMARDDLHARFGTFDLTCAHPPYGSQIAYDSGEGDLSSLGDGDDFLDELLATAHNLRSATKRGGHYVLILGDTRKKGAYFSSQAAVIEGLPRSELRAVRIKEQHHTTSSSRDYGHIRFGLLSHEYVLIFERTLTPFAAFQEVARQQHARLRGTWKQVVRSALTRLGGHAHLSELYRLIAEGAPERVRENPNYQAKVRQTLQLLGGAISDGQGHWRLVA